MRKFAALILAFTIISLNIFPLFSCSNLDFSGIFENQAESPDTPKEPTSPPEQPQQPEQTQKNEIHVPQYKDHGRGTIDFSDIEYSRPDFSKIISDFESTASLIKSNGASYEEQLEKVYALKPGYNAISTMYSYANIMNSADSQDTYWSVEYEFIATEYPKFMQAVEGLFVAAATSVHAEKFETDYFGNGLIEEYGNGAKYTDKVIALMQDEALLEADYASLSTLTVTIKYYGYSGTVENILARYEQFYGKESIEYERAKSDCEALAESALSERSMDILVELFKVRRMISDELGYDSYAELAYNEIYHDYNQKEFLAFADDVKSYVIPVYSKLANYVFNQHPDPTSNTLSRVDLINNMHDMLKGTNDELSEIFEYMLQHSLYNIESDNETRFHGAFTSYLDSYSAPFIFISTVENITDYTTLSHEFGHFADNYVNFDAQSSLDLAEVLSQSLELLVSTRFDGVLTNADQEYLKLYLIENALMCLISQTFYATFEHIAYEIPVDEINRTSLSNAVKSAAQRTGLNSSAISIRDVLIPHIFLYPFYVQSYSTSVAASLEIYLMELETQGAGFEVFDQLLHRDTASELTFTETLESVGLTDPFSNKYLMMLSDRIHYNLLGSHYFKTLGVGNAA